MDRSEAYKLLCEEMEKLTQLFPDQLNNLQENDLEIDRLGHDGTRYSVILAVAPLGSDRFNIIGKIHDNNSYRFSILEERLEFTARQNDS